MSRSHIVLGALIAATLAIIATILVSVVSGNHMVQVAASVGLVVSVRGQRRPAGQQRWLDARLPRHSRTPSPARRW